MRKSLLVLIIVIASAIIAVAVYHFAFDTSPSPSASPTPSLSASPIHSPLPTPIPPTTDISLSQYSISVVQGDSFSVNVTVKSLIKNETIAKTVGVQLLGFNNSAWSGNPQEIFNSSFTVNPIVIGPEEEKSTMLTMSIADDAFIGRYSFAVGSVQLVVFVTPKLT